MNQRPRIPFEDAAFVSFFSRLVHSSGPFADKQMRNANFQDEGSMRAAPGNIDVQENERLQGKVLRLDPLTGLPNRVLFDDCLRQVIRLYQRRRLPFAVVSLELDGFRKINQLHGRAAGDQLLTELAKGMQHALRRGDMLARLCGQNFAAILPDATSVQDCVPVITRLLDAATEPVPVGELVLQATASIGVAFYPQDGGVDALRLLELAGHAMRQARRAGRNLYRFSEVSSISPKARVAERLDEIKQALAQRQFVLFYQPTINLREGRVVGAEALIRWRHPEHGLLAPGDFLPHIEEDRLCIELGEWVIESALIQMEEWWEKGLQINISVNFSPRQLRHPEFVERLKSILERFPAPLRTALELDIPGAAGQDAARLLQLVTACRALGLSVALDNFGTSRSTLADLKLLPVNVVKIDALFVRELTVNPDDVAILEGILSIAGAMGRRSVAEGVETPEHALLLLRLGCECAQGYGIAVPMEAHDLPSWVENWRPEPAWAEIDTRGVDERLLAWAGVEHQSWIAALEAWIEGRLPAEPRLSRHQCRLGAFIDAEEQAGRGYSPALQALTALHWRLHAVGAGIAKLHALGKSAEARSRLEELPALLEKQLEQLRNFRLRVDPILDKKSAGRSEE
jgi:diguanylate cyclase (GGDEF)-like protein